MIPFCFTKYNRHEGRKLTVIQWNEPSKYYVIRIGNKKSLKTVLFIASFFMRQKLYRYLHWRLYDEMPKVTKCPCMTKCPWTKCLNDILPKYDKIPRAIKYPKDIMPKMTTCPTSHFVQGDKLSLRRHHLCLSLQNASL